MINFSFSSHFLGESSCESSLGKVYSSVINRIRTAFGSAFGFADCGGSNKFLTP